MFDLIATVLAWFYDLVPSYGVAIVLLTIAVMLLVTPLTLKGTRSMLELQAHQPELRRIQTQYRDDRQKMNEELMKFYAEHKINPVGGCLPLLVQLPVFIVLYNVIRGLTTRIDLLDATIAGDPLDVGNFDPKYLDESTRLFRDLSDTNHMDFLSIDLSRSAVQAMGEGLGTALPYVLLILGATATSYYQQAQIQKRATGPANPQMQMITRIMPLFITFISLTLPAALVVYFFVSGCYRIGQQAIITRHIYTDEVKERLATARAAGDNGPITTTGRDGAPTGGFMSRLLNAADPNAGGGAAGGGGAAKASKSAGGKGTATTTSGSAPAARTSGRTTPPGSRPAAARKRKKRK